MLLVRTFLAPSPIEGVGCFSANHVSRGRAIWRFVPGFDRLIMPDFARELDPDFLDKYAQRCPYSGCWILCADNARLMNHSEEPNVRVVAPLSDPRRTHDAIRDIAAGEELTCDYRVGDAAPFSGFIPLQQHP